MSPKVLVTEDTKLYQRVFYIYHTLHFSFLYILHFTSTVTGTNITINFLLLLIKINLKDVFFIFAIFLL